MQLKSILIDRVIQGVPKLTPKFNIVSGYNGEYIKMPKEMYFYDAQFTRKNKKSMTSHSAQDHFI